MTSHGHNSPNGFDRTLEHYRQSLLTIQRSLRLARLRLMERALQGPRMAHGSHSLSSKATTDI